LSSDTEDTKPIDKNASEALQGFRDVMRVLVERPADNPLPFEAKLNSKDLARFESLVGKYAGLLPALELHSTALSATALLGAFALQAGRIKVADDIYEEVNFRASNVTALAYVMQGVLQFVGAMLVLVLLSFLILFTVAIFRYKPDSFPVPSLTFPVPSLTSEFAKVSIGSVFGCFGGVVSLLMRLHDFEVLQGKSRIFLRAYGGTQPLIGGIFACVLGAIVSAKIINISVGGNSDLSTWFFIVLGFLAGFSERFTRNLLHIAEGHFGGATGPTP
jgi:uncharacterized membrane protein